MVSKNKRAGKFTRPRSRQGVLLVILIIVLIGLGVWALFLRHHPATSGVIPASSSQNSTGGTGNNTSGTGSSSSQNSNTPSPKAVAGNGTPSTPTSSGSSPSVVVSTPPTGDFVSNHHPNLGGSPAPSTEQSTCNTAPGASCYIQFTKNGVVKTLPAKIADNNGVVIWNWDVKSAGFDAGSWKITAIAGTGDQAKSSTDSLALEVQP